MMPLGNAWLLRFHRSCLSTTVKSLQPLLTKPSIYPKRPIFVLLIAFCVQGFLCSRCSHCTKSLLPELPSLRDQSIRSVAVSPVVTRHGTEWVDARRGVQKSQPRGGRARSCVQHS